MPVICRPCTNQKVKLCMYADDHVPPHFHLLGPDFSAVLDLATLTVTRGSAPAAVLDEARAYARANTGFLRQKWSDLNERD